jgi:hypothetical protein
MDIPALVSSLADAATFSHLTSHIQNDDAANEYFAEKHLIHVKGDEYTYSDKAAEVYESFVLYYEQVIKEHLEEIGSK